MMPELAIGCKVWTVRTIKVPAILGNNHGFNCENAALNPFTALAVGAPQFVVPARL